MRRFAAMLLSFLSPFLFFLMVVGIRYYQTDPYFDFGPYPNYSWKYNFQILGDLSTKKLLESDKNYNSFIFGSSRSTAYYACYLEHQLPGSRFFHFASWTESIGGMEKRFRLIDSLGMHAANVFFIIDPDFTFLNDGSISPMDHYLLTGKSRFTYLAEQHFKQFLDKPSRDKTAIFSGQLPSGATLVNWSSDLRTNDANHTCSPEVLDAYKINKPISDSLRRKLYESGAMHPRSGIVKYLPDQISKSEEFSLMAISDLIRKHHSNCRVIINPAYEQVKLSRRDSLLLRKYLGNFIYDFSGINRFTLNERNYTDGKHFQHHTGKEILDEVFKGNRNNVSRN